MDIESLRQRFDDQGYVVLRNHFAPSVVEGGKRAMDRLVDRCAEQLLQQGLVDDVLRDEPFETRLYRLYADHLDIAPNSFRRELHLPELYDFFFDARLLDVLEGFLGPEIRLYPNYTARPKLPDWEGTLVLWHQDGGYTENTRKVEGRVDEMRMVNVWSPLVPACEANGCMQFVPGTHKLGVVPHEDRGLYLEVAPDVLEPRVKDAVSVELDPGDVVLFHNLLFHQGLPNQTDRIRWSLDWRYQDATQPTLRDDVGHLARSRERPEQVVASADEWAHREFV